jgi:hypothetical protein
MYVQPGALYRHVINFARALVNGAFNMFFTTTYEI